MCKPLELPVDLATLLPQKRPMRLVDTLDKVGDGIGELTATVEKEMPFVGHDGRLDGAAFMEMIAQGIAALNAFEGYAGSETSHEGLLLGARDLEIHESGFVGDVLKICVQKQAKLGEFGIVEGLVTRGGQILAHGMVTVWAKDASGTRRGRHGSDATSRGRK